MKRMFSKSIARMILNDGMRLYINEVCCNSTPRSELRFSSNGHLLRSSVKKAILCGYRALYQSGHYVEAYCLLKAIFGELTSLEMMNIYEEGIVLTEKEVIRYLESEVSRYDPEIPF